MRDKPLDEKRRPFLVCFLVFPQRAVERDFFEHREGYTGVIVPVLADLNFKLCCRRSADDLEKISVRNPVFTHDHSPARPALRWRSSYNKGKVFRSHMIGKTKLTGFEQH